MSHFADQKKPQTRNVWLQPFPVRCLSTDRGQTHQHGQGVSLGSFLGCKAVLTVGFSSSHPLFAFSFPFPFAVKYRDLGSRPCGIEPRWELEGRAAGPAGIPDLCWQPGAGTEQIPPWPSPPSLELSRNTFFPHSSHFPVFICALFFFFFLF